MTVLDVLDEGAGDPPVLFLHGLGGDRHSWDPQIEAMSPQHRCLAWTMPGYGGSEPLAEMTFEALAARAASLIVDQFGGSAAVVVGHSMGGMVAQQLALDRADLVDRLVLVATTAAFGRPGSSFNEMFLAARLEPLDRGQTPGSLSPDVVDGLLGSGADPKARPAAIASMSRIGVDAYRAALRCLVTWDATDRLGSLDADTLCIAGGADRTAPVVAMERLQQLIPSAELTVVDGAGHLVNLERPDEFTAILRHWLA